MTTATAPTITFKEPRQPANSTTSENYLVITPQGELDLSDVDPEDITHNTQFPWQAETITINQYGTDYIINTADAEQDVLEIIYEIVQPT